GGVVGVAPLSAPRRGRPRRRKGYARKAAPASTRRHGDGSRPAVVGASREGLLDDDRPHHRRMDRAVVADGPGRGEGHGTGGRARRSLPGIEDAVAGGGARAVPVVVVRVARAVLDDAVDDAVLVAPGDLLPDLRRDRIGREGLDSALAEDPDHAGGAGVGRVPRGGG